MRTTSLAGASAGQRPNGLRFAVSLLIFVTALCMFVPFQPTFPQAGLDPSWRLGLNEAIVRGFLFGSQTIFTFGPYAPLFTFEYHPSLVMLSLGAGVFLALSYAACLHSITARDAIVLPVVVCLLIASLDGPRDVLLLSSPMLTTVATFAYLRADPDGPDRPSLWSMAFFYSPLGLLPLIKGTFVVVCIAAVVVTCGFAWQRRRRWLAAVVVLAPAATAIVAWTAVGQPPLQFLAYLRSMASTVSSYSEAMASPGDPRDIPCFLVAATILLLAIAAHRPTRIALRLYLVVAFGLYLFVAFKGAFVRHDSEHLPMSARPILLAGLFVLLVIRSVPLYLSVLVAALFWLAVGHREDTGFPSSLPARIATPYRDALAGLSKRLRDGRWPRDAYDRALADVDAAYPFPRLGGTTDIYSYNQTSLIAAGDDWWPRPVFQSYAANDARMLALNADHLRGPRAPLNVVFSIEPIDGRFPPLEDGASWSPLLAGYRATGLHDDLLLLVKNASPSASSDATPVTSSHAMGESVALPASDDLVYMRLAIRPSLLGMLGGILFKTDVPTIVVTLDDGRQRTYRLLPKMAASEFLMSPLVENTDDFARLFAVYDDLPPKKVASFTVLPPRSRVSYWQDRYEASIVLRPVAPGPTAPARTLHHRTRPVADPAANDALERGRCDGKLESWSAQQSAPRTDSEAGILDLEGWLVAPSGGGRPWAPYAVLTDDSGRRTFAPLRRRLRSDLVQFLKRPDLANSGFHGTVDLAGLSGTYTIGIASKADDRWTLCDGFERTLRIGGR